MNDTFSQTGSPALERSKGFFLRLYQTFLSPKAAFSGRFSPRQWVIALLVTGLLSIVTQSLQGPYLAPDLKRAALGQLERVRDQFSAQQYQEIRQEIEDSIEDKLKITPLNVLTELVSAALFALFIALAAWLGGNFFLAGDSPFWRVLTVIVFAGFIGLAGDFARTALMIVKGSSYVYIGFGSFYGAATDSFLYYLTRQMEFFSMWRIAATCIGLGAIYGKPALKFAFILVPLWLGFAALVAFANGLMGGALIY